MLIQLISFHTFAAGFQLASNVIFILLPFICDLIWNYEVELVRQTPQHRSSSRWSRDGRDGRDVPPALARGVSSGLTDGDNEQI